MYRRIKGQWNSAKFVFGSMIRPLLSSHIVYLCDGLPNDEFPYSLFAFLPLLGRTIADFLTFAFVVSSLVCWVDAFFRVRRSLFQSICCRFHDANNEQKADAHDRCHCHFVFEPSVRTILSKIQIDWIQFFFHRISHRNSFVSIPCVPNPRPCLEFVWPQCLQAISFIIQKWLNRRGIDVWTVHSSIVFSWYNK